MTVERRRWWWGGAGRGNDRGVDGRGVVADGHAHGGGRTGQGLGRAAGQPGERAASRRIHKAILASRGVAFPPLDFPHSAPAAPCWMLFLRVPDLIPAPLWSHWFCVLVSRFRSSRAGFLGVEAMATALAAVRLPRPQPDAVDAVQRHRDVVPAVRELGSSGVRVRASAAVGGFSPERISWESRGRICRVPFFRTSSPRREALVSAMSEGEHDITDMQETDKVSGEWWKSVLTAVHNWSSDKLLGLAELADGSLFFSFGGSDPPRPAVKIAAQPRAQSETKVNGSTHNMTPPTLPKRQPSIFRKHSPIPASRKKASVSKEATPATQPQAEDKKIQKAKTSSKPDIPQRPPSSFSKRSPIPRDGESVPASASKKKSYSPEVLPAAAAPTKATSEKAAPAKAASYSEKDSPFSPELKEILSHGKEAAGQQSKDTPKSKTDAKTTSAAPAKKKSSKPPSEETEVAPPVENGAVSEDLGSYKLPELRNLAKARGLKGYSKLKKSELVDLLASSDS